MILETAVDRQSACARLPEIESFRLRSTSSLMCASIQTGMISLSILYALEPMAVRSLPASR